MKYWGVWIVKLLADLLTEKIKHGTGQKDRRLDGAERGIIKKICDLFSTGQADHNWNLSDLTLDVHHKGNWFDPEYYKQPNYGRKTISQLAEDLRALSIEELREIEHEVFPKQPPVQNTNDFGDFELPKLDL